MQMLQGASPQAKKSLDGQVIHMVTGFYEGQKKKRGGGGGKRKKKSTKEFPCVDIASMSFVRITL